MTTSSHAPASGTQYELRAGSTTAVIASVGATVRILHDEWGDLVVPFEANDVRPDMSGALLAPWPNRTADGRYEFGGAVHQLVVNEPDLGTASHGLVAWLDFQLVEQTAHSVALTGTIEAQPGYPWQVRLDVVFTLDDDGLTQRVVATNESPEPAPFGVAGHPYLTAAPPRVGAVDEWYLELPAGEVMLVSPDRLLPVSVESVAVQNGELDFRSRRVIGATAINHAYGALQKGADGMTRVRVTTQAGLGVELLCDAACRWVQVYSADLGNPRSRRHALAVEPMTCPPNALNSKRDLVVIPPGGTFAAAWTIRRLVSQ
jgi:aldose 1-epimerase